MAFIQIVDFTTTRLDEMLEVERQWESATAGRRTTRRRIFVRDRDNPDRYLNIVFFDSYESAMENSNLPETSEFSGKMMGMASGPATFLNLDVIEDAEG